uniref:protein FAM3A isoform X2 n=1 Tax=Halichoerus grypus TaxID=9711 RepID=UPI00165934E6|nr:protein FAM3A isoform X2 [Halichoerus grypus]
MRLAGPLRIVALVVTVGLTWIVVSILLGGPGSGFPRIQQLFTSPENSVTTEPRARKYKCGLPQPCPEEHLAFRMVSGAANVIGPKICLEDKMLMSSVKDNVGRGLNIALVNDVNDLLKFIRPLHEGTLVFVASYDDPATKMNEETRKLFSDLGSKNVKDLAFRDSWVFVGAKGVQNKSPFEQMLRLVPSCCDPVPWFTPHFVLPPAPAALWSTAPPEPHVQAPGTILICGRLLAWCKPQCPPVLPPTHTHSRTRQTRCSVVSGRLWLPEKSNSAPREEMRPLALFFLKLPAAPCGPGEGGNVHHVPPLPSLCVPGPHTCRAVGSPTLHLREAGLCSYCHFVDEKGTESSVCPLCLRAEAMTSCSPNPTAREEQ